MPLIPLRIVRFEYVGLINCFDVKNSSKNNLVNLLLYILEVTDENFPPLSYSCRVYAYISDLWDCTVEYVQLAIPVG